MERITEGKTKAKYTPAMVTKFSNDVAFELKVKYGLRKGDLVKCFHTLPAQTRIEKYPLFPGQSDTEVENASIEGETSLMYIGPAFDYWTGKMFIEFIEGERVLYYNYWDNHQAGDESWATSFQKL